MESNPLVSIVIPVYNGSNYMREAIESALAQTYQNIEILVVNDGSTDDTREIALSYGDRIRYFEKENGGVSTALNLAIKNMRGEYFSWLSHDDVYYPDKVEAEIWALKAAGDMNLAVYSGWDALIMPERRVVPYNDYAFFERLAKKYFAVGTLAPLMGFISGCTLLIPRKYFDVYGLFDESLRCVQDYKLWFTMFRGKRLIYVDRRLIQSRYHSERVTNRSSRMREEEDWLYHWMMENLTDDDFGDIDLDLYRVLGAVLPRMMYLNLEKSQEFVIRKLMELPEPVDSDKLRANFSETLKKSQSTDTAGNFMSKDGETYLISPGDKGDGLHGNFTSEDGGIYRADPGEIGHGLHGNFTRENGGIWLYCAGDRGEALALALRLRGVEVDGFSDTNPGKWGRSIGGIRCLPPREIPRGSLVIVTKLQSGEIPAWLHNHGYDNVAVYDDFIESLIKVAVNKTLLRQIFT